MELKQDLLLQQPTQLVQEPNPVVYGGAQVRSSCKMHAPRARREGNPPVVLMLSLLLTDACSDARVRGRWGSCVQVVEEPQQQIYMAQPQQPQQLYIAVDNSAAFPCCTPVAIGTALSPSVARSLCTGRWAWRCTGRL